MDWSKFEQCLPKKGLANMFLSAAGQQSTPTASIPLEISALCPILALCSGLFLEVSRKQPQRDGYLCNGQLKELGSPQLWNTQPCCLH